MRAEELTKALREAVEASIAEAEAQVSHEAFCRTARAANEAWERVQAALARLKL